MSAQEAAAQRILLLLEEGKEGEGTSLTREQCTTLLEYIDERFNEGYACGGNNAAWQ